MFASEKVKATEGLVMLAGILSAGVLAYQGAMRVARIYGPLQAIGLVALAVVAILAYERARRRELTDERAQRRACTERCAKEAEAHRLDLAAQAEEHERRWKAREEDFAARSREAATQPASVQESVSKKRPTPSKWKFARWDDQFRVFHAWVRMESDENRRHSGWGLVFSPIDDGNRDWEVRWYGRPIPGFSSVGFSSKAAALEFLFKRAMEPPPPMVEDIANKGTEPTTLP